MSTAIKTMPKVERYHDYAGGNYGINALMFTDSKGRRFFFSYTTLVAFDHPSGLVVRENTWGPTTGKHLNSINPDKSSRVDAETFQNMLDDLD